MFGVPTETVTQLLLYYIMQHNFSSTIRSKATVCAINQSHFCVDTFSINTITREITALVRFFTNHKTTAMPFGGQFKQ